MRIFGILQVIILSMGLGKFLKSMVLFNNKILKKKNQFFILCNYGKNILYWENVNFYII